MKLIGVNRDIGTVTDRDDLFPAHKEPETRYEKLVHAVLVGEERSLSDKSLAMRLGVSERQTRKLRLEGYVDDYTADKMACKAGLHPGFLFGYDDWIGDEENQLRLDREADEADAKRAKKQAKEAKALLTA